MEEIETGELSASVSFSNRRAASQDVRPASQCKSQKDIPLMASSSLSRLATASTVIAVVLLILNTTYIATFQRWLVHEARDVQRSTEYGSEPVAVFVLFGTNILVTAALFLGVWSQRRQLVIVWLVYHAAALIAKIAYTAYSAMDARQVYLTMAFLIEVPCWVTVVVYCVEANGSFVSASAITDAAALTDKMSKRTVLLQVLVIAGSLLILLCNAYSLAVDWYRRAPNVDQSKAVTAILLVNFPATLLLLFATCNHNRCLLLLWLVYAAITLVVLTVLCALNAAIQPLPLSATLLVGIPDWLLVAALAKANNY